MVIEIDGEVGVHGEIPQQVRPDAIFLLLRILVRTLLRTLVLKNLLFAKLLLDGVAVELQRIDEVIILLLHQEAERQQKDDAGQQEKDRHDQRCRP